MSEGLSRHADDLWSHLKGKELPSCVRFLRKTLALSSHVCSILNRPACDASFRIREDEQVEVIPHQVGQSVNIRSFATTSILWKDCSPCLIP